MEVDGVVIGVGQKTKCALPRKSRGVLLILTLSLGLILLLQRTVLIELGYVHLLGRGIKTLPLMFGCITG